MCDVSIAPERPSLRSLTARTCNLSTSMILPIAIPTGEAKTMDFRANAASMDEAADTSCEGVSWDRLHQSDSILHTFRSTGELIKLSLLQDNNADRVPEVRIVRRPLTIHGLRNTGPSPKLKSLFSPNVPFVSGKTDTDPLARPITRYGRGSEPLVPKS